MTATFVGHYPWFVVYNFLQSKVPPQSGALKLLRSAIIGFCSSFTSDVCSNGVRVVKTAKQTSKESITYTATASKIIAEDGVRVNAVAPGPFWTPLQPSGGQPQDKIEEFGSQVPLGRPGQPAEIASTYVFLATQESGYITGEVFGVTGGDPTM